HTRPTLFPYTTLFRSLKASVDRILHADDIMAYQDLVRRVPVVDNVVDYAVKLVHKTRPNTEMAAATANQFLEWGAGPRASQHLIDRKSTRLNSSHVKI